MLETKVDTTFSLELAQRDILNLGCGRKYLSEAFNIDRSTDTNPDLVHDLNKTPWPLADDHFRKVLAYDVIEHLDDVIVALEEIHRISCNGAVVQLTVPHFSSSNTFTDITHRHCFGFFSLDYFDSEHELSFYTRARFKRRHARIIFHPTILNKLISRLANRYPASYERRWAWIFPAWFLYFELEVLKDAASVSASAHQSGD